MVSVFMREMSMMTENWVLNPKEGKQFWIKCKQILNINFLKEDN